MIRRSIRAFVKGILSSARPDSRRASIYAPPFDGFRPEVKQRTIREACRHTLETGPMHYRDLAEMIGRHHASVAAVLSNMPEFCCVNSGSGYWRLDPHFTAAGWMTVGR